MAGGIGSPACNLSAGRKDLSGVRNKFADEVEQPKTPVSLRLIGGIGGVAGAFVGGLVASVRTTGMRNLVAGAGAGALLGALGIVAITTWAGGGCWP